MKDQLDKVAKKLAQSMRYSTLKEERTHIKQAFEFIKRDVKLSRAARATLAEIYSGSYDSLREAGLEIALEDFEIRKGRRKI